MKRRLVAAAYSSQRGGHRTRGHVQGDMWARAFVVPLTRKPGQGGPAVQGAVVQDFRGSWVDPHRAVLLWLGAEVAVWPGLGWKVRAVLSWGSWLLWPLLGRLAGENCAQLLVAGKV